MLAFASTLTILSFASRAFASYYFLQCLVAISVSKSTAQKVTISLLAAALAQYVQKRSRARSRALSQGTMEFPVTVQPDFRNSGMLTSGEFPLSISR